MSTITQTLCELVSATFLAIVIDNTRGEKAQKAQINLLAETSTLIVQSRLLRSTLVVRVTQVNFVIPGSLQILMVQEKEIKGGDAKAYN